MRASPLPPSRRPLGTSCGRPPARGGSLCRSRIRGEAAATAAWLPVSMHPIGGWPSDPRHRALLPFSNPAATQSLSLTSTTPARHSQTDNEHDPSPSSTSNRALTPAASTTAADGRPRRAGARPRRRAQRVESDVRDRPQPARGTPSSARRPDRLAHRIARAGGRGNLDLASNRGLGSTRRAVCFDAERLRPGNPVRS
jgi:hypothetical protein